MTRKQTINAVLGTLAFIVLFGIVGTLDREDAATQEAATLSVNAYNRFGDIYEEADDEELKTIYAATYGAEE